MNELDYHLQQNPMILDTESSMSEAEKLLDKSASKLETLSQNRAAKELKLRRDDKVYEEDNFITQGLKEAANAVLPHEYQIGINKFGGQYDTANKTFNEDDLTGIWNKYEDNPAGNKSLYYLRKQDPYTGKYVYKPGIANVSASERYLTQEKADGWELIGEKRFDEASEVEKQIHGNKEFLKSRVFDRGTTGEGGADNFFGAGKTELYDRDILGIDTGTSEQYRANQDESFDRMIGISENMSTKQKEDTFEFIDALQAGGITLGAQAIKLIGEAVSTSDEDGAIETFGKKLQADANKIAGYNPVASAEAMKGLEDSFNRGDYVGYAFNMAKGAPQWLANSLPNMAAFAAISGATTAATGGNVGAGLAAGSAFMGAIRANDVLDNREKITGRKATGEEVAAVYGTSSVLSLLEYGALKYAFTGKGLIVKDPAGNVKNLGKELFKNNTKLGEVAMFLGNRAKGSGVEGGEEVIAGLTEFVMENYGTEKYGGQTIADLLVSDEARTTAIQSFGAGAGAGGLASVVGPEGAKDITKILATDKVAEQVSDEAAKKGEFNEAQKEYRDTVRAEQELGTDEDVKFTEEQQAEFDSLATVEEVSEIDTFSAELDELDTEIETLVQERDSLSSKTDAEKIAELDTMIADKEAELDNKLGIQDDRIAATVEESIQAEVDTNTARLEKEGVAKEDIDADNEVLRTKLTEARGVAATKLSAKDKADGLSIELTDNLSGVRLDNKGQKKRQTFDAYEVKDETIKEIVQGGFTVETAKKLLGKVNASKISESLVKHLKSESKVRKELETIQNTISDTLNTDEGKAAIGNLLDDDVEGKSEKVMRMVALALAQVKSNIASEYHVNKNAGLKSDKQHARTSDVVQQLGKDYVNSYGIKYAGTDTALATKYGEIGQQILDFSEEAGFITQGKAKVSALSLVDAEGKPMSDKDMKTMVNVATSEINVNNKPVNMINTAVITLNDNVGSKNGVVDSAKAFAGTVLAKILRPTNTEVPTTEPVEEVLSDTSNLSEQHQNIIRNMNKMEFRIKPETLELFKEIREMVYGEDGSKDFDVGSKSPEIQKLLSLLGSKADVNKDKDSGRSLNKTDNLRNVIDNIDAVLDGFHYNYESAINQRIHVMQTILDFQGDKYMARNAITGGTYTTSSNVERKLLLDSVSEEIGMSIGELYTDGELTEAVRILKKRGTIKLRDLMSIGDRVGVANPFKLLSLLKAVKDIRDAGKGKNITTDYMVEVDASASGVTNTLLNLSGNPAVQKILQKMTIMGGNMDPYAIVNEGVKEVNDTFGKHVQPILDKFSTIYGNDNKALAKGMRQLAKYPVMTWFYGSSTGNVATLMAEDIAQEILTKALDGNKEATSLINELTGKEYSTVTVATVSDADLATMKKYYADNVGSVYASSMSEIFKGVKNYRNNMTSLFKILEGTGKWDGMLPTAIAALEGKPNENKMSVRKRKQFIERPMGTSNYEQVLSRMFNNVTSMSVNPQHATDAALLLKAMDKVMSRHPEMQGVMTVHDATYGNPKILLEVKAEYDKLTTEVAIKYDYVEAAISEAREAIAKMEDSSDKVSFTKQVDEIEVDNKELQKSKAEFLKDKKVSVLEGAKPIREVKVVEEKVEAKPEVKEEKPKKKVYVAKEIMDIAKSIKEGESFLPLIEFIENLEVSKLNEKVKAKILEALNSGKLDVDAGLAKVDNEYASLPGQLILGLGGKDRRFEPDNVKKQENFTADSLVETLGHEVDHAFNWTYIAENKNKAEVKYMTKVANKIVNMDVDGLSPEAAARVNYIKDEFTRNGTESALAETISILGNEGEVAAEIVQKVPNVSDRTLLETVKAMIKDIAAYIFDMSPAERVKTLNSDTGVRSENILLALQMIQDETTIRSEAELKGEGKPRKVTGSKQRDVYQDAFLNPHKYAEGIIAKNNHYVSLMMFLLGNVIVDKIGPVVGEGHTRAKRRFAIYRDTVNVVRSGFIDSEIAKKMKSTLGVARNTNTVVLNEMLSAADQINQETKTILTTDLKNLENRINKLYPDEKDQVTIFELFSRTGISGLQYDEEVMKGLLDGDMTIDEAVTVATKGMSARDKKSADALATYYVTGVTKDMKVNTEAAELFSGNDRLVVALMAMSKVDGAQKMLDGMDSKLKKELVAISISVQSLSDEINMRQPGYDGVVHSNEPRYDIDYDGHYMKDVYNDKYEYKIVTGSQLKTSKYTSADDWVTVKEPKGNVMGLVARKRIGGSMTPGVGLNSNKFNNGFHMSEDDSGVVQAKMSGMNATEAKKFLNDNGLVMDSSGKKFRFILDTKTKVEKLGMKQDIANSLMRTYAHNLELVQMQSVRDIMLNSATDKLDKVGMDKLNEDILYNRNKSVKDEGRVLPMFVTIDYKYESYEDLPKWVKSEYRTPSNVSTYNGLNTKVQLVRKGEADILLGHKNFSFFGGTDNRSAARWEQGFKELVVMAKQKMVVANAGKLAIDIVSNMGILAAKDVSIFEIKELIPEAFREYTDFSKKRTEIVQMELKARMGDKDAVKKLAVMKKKIEKHKFYTAQKYGFVQSYSTSLVTQDFDTLQGLQHNIDEIVDGITRDKSGKPNEVFKAIKMWQQFGDKKGLGVDHLVKWASEISKVKGTYIGDEMANMAKRLRDKKDVDSVTRYVGDIIGSPASELVTLGGAVMVSADAVSKYTLAKSLMKRTNLKTDKKYTEEEAYMEANETFIDYRQNVPSEIKAMSDYGVMMFPNFWLKAQKVIAGLVTYHPATAIGGYAIADMLDMNSANFIDVNIVNRIADGRLLNDPTNLIDWEILSPWL